MLTKGLTYKPIIVWPWGQRVSRSIFSFHFHLRMASLRVTQDQYVSGHAGLQSPLYMCTLSDCQTAW